MHLDIERYRPFVDHFDMDEVRKVELIHIVSRIMQSFVERTFGKSPEQILLGTNSISVISSEPVELDSNDINLIFNEAANGRAEEEGSYE